MASGHGVNKPDKAHHPARKVERMDYHTNTVEQAAQHAANNAPRASQEDLQRIARSGRTLSPEERYDLYS